MPTAGVTGPPVLSRQQLHPSPHKMAPIKMPTQPVQMKAALDASDVEIQPLPHPCLIPPSSITHFHKGGEPRSTLGLLPVALLVVLRPASHPIRL